MFCPRCGGNNCQVITEVATEGKDFSASKGCCGWFFFGPMGILCGLCGKGKQTYSTNFWVCTDCGNKWRL